MPTAVTLSTSGDLTGTPQVGTAGSWGVTIQVADSCSLGTQTHTRTLDPTIGPGCPEPLPSVTTTGLASGTERDTYEVLQATGGTGLLTWSLASGALPSGLTRSSSGILWGTPSAGSAGTHFFEVRVEDSFTTGGRTAQKSLDVTIIAACYPGPYITTPMLPDAHVATSHNEAPLERRPPSL